MNKRIYNLNIKMNGTEKEELSRLMQEQEKSASDIIRLAIRNTFDCEGFEPSYDNSIYRSKKRSIFD